MKRPGLWGLCVGLFFLLSASLYFLNVTPWLFFAEILYLAWEALRIRYGNSLAITGGILGLFFVISLWQYISPLTGLDLEVSNFLILTLLGITFTLLILLSDSRRVLPSVRSSVLFIPVLVVSGVTTFFVTWFQIAAQPHVSFAMNGDAVWNTVTARFVIDDGGIVPLSHPNPAPLTAELLASVDAPGRNLVATQDLVLHDIVRQSQLWFVLLGLTSIIVMVLVSMSLRGATRHLSQAIVLLAALLPYTWFFSGFAFFFGFYNATIGILVMLACWHSWLRVKTNPLCTLSLLSAGSVVLLATWAPLVVISGSLMVATMISKEWSYWFKESLFRKIALVCAGLVPLAYFALFSLADLRREGPALSVDGGIFEISPYLLPALVIFIAVVTGVKQKSNYSQLAFWGTLCIAVGTGIALGYLLWQRKDVSQLWGYYPIKFSWLVATLLIVILLTVLLHKFDFSKKNAVRSTLILVLVGAITGAFMLFAKPLGVTELFSPAAVIFSKGVGVNDQVVPTISELAAERDVVVAVKYGQSTQQDLFINNWLLQLPVDRPDSLQRWYSYYLDGTDFELVCKAGIDLKQSIEIVTKDNLLDQQLESLCSNADIVVKVVE